MMNKLKQFFSIFIISSSPPFLIYWIGMYLIDDYGSYLGYFGIFSVFSIHVLVWSFLGGFGFIISSFLTKRSLKGQNLPFKYLVILGLLIGISHFLFQINIEFFIVLLPLALLISCFYNFILYHFLARQDKQIQRVSVVDFENK